MKKEIFNVEEFNIIQDEENYYFFRALNMGDNNDIEQGITLNANGTYARIRTDRERYEGETKYSEDAEITLEEIFDHIKMHSRKDTNCISLTSNANVALTYGRGSYKDKYVMVKVPKKEMGENVVNAGQYMLGQLEQSIDEAMSRLRANEEKRAKISKVFEEIETATTSNQLKEMIEKRYQSANVINPSKASMKKGITYQAPQARISSYQSLNQEQTLEKNKIMAKLAVLENNGAIARILPNTANKNLIRTIGNAFSSAEQIHYGEIPAEKIIDIPTEIVDMFALLQQVVNQDVHTVNSIKEELLAAINRNVLITNSRIEIETFKQKENITIEEMYELTNGRVDYAVAKSKIREMFYLSASKIRARELARMMQDLTSNNPEYQEIIESIEKNGFAIEPEIITRQNGKGVRLSESVNLDLESDEVGLIEEIQKLKDEEIITILQQGGLSNVKGILEKEFSQVQENEKISRELYYASAIIDMYPWHEIGIKEFSVAQKNELIQKLQEKNCIEIYHKLKQVGIEENEIPTILFNIVIRPDYLENMNSNQDTRFLQENLDDLRQNLSIEQLENFLGYYTIEGTNIQLRDYQQNAVNKTNHIFEEKRFASVILPTGAGKSFVALTEMLEHKDEPILYLAPSNEILEQIENYIVRYVHGTKGTLGKNKADIIKEVFPNLKLATYASLLSRNQKEMLEKEYQFIVLDELHRTGAQQWQKKLDVLLKHQGDNTKVLGITATPQRDADDLNMADEMAEKLGYTSEEIKDRKHIAMDMELMDAIRLGLVVNPKIVNCEYTLQTDGSMEKLLEQINSIEDKNLRNQKIRRYEQLRRKLDNAKGIPQILQENVKKGGKYIVFIPVTDKNGMQAIEDEDGNQIEKQTGEDRIQEYIQQLKNQFEETDIRPEFYSMLGSYTDKKNTEELQGFESSNTENTKFMVVMNKLNEGVHVDGVDGIIWMRALDENSKILYLQQLGRIIYSLDANNPIQEGDRPIAIDLANNTLNVNMTKEEKITSRRDDLELLRIIVDWIEEHNGYIPDINSYNKKEARYAATLKRIQEKYNKYLNGFHDYGYLEESEIEDIRSVLNEGAEIDLWNIILSEKEQSNQIDDTDMGIFEITGMMHDYYELNDEVEGIIESNRAIKNVNELEEWCQEKNEGKKNYQRVFPRSTIKGVSSATLEERKNGQETEAQRERRLGLVVSNFKQKNPIYQTYQEGRKEELTDKEIEIIEKLIYLEKEYRIEPYEANILELEEWCEEKNEGKKRYERVFPKEIKGVKTAIPEEREKGQETEKQRERRLAGAVQSLKKSNPIYQTYQEGRKEELTDKEIEIIEKLIYLEKEYRIEPYEANILELEEWCEEKNEGKKRYKRVFPKVIKGVKTATPEEREKGQETEKQRELRLAGAVQSLKKSNPIYQKYQEGRKEDLTDKEIEIVEKLIYLEKEYNLEIYIANILELEEWCEEKNEGKKRYERVFPKVIKGVKTATPEEREKGQETEEQREKRLCQATRTFKCQSKIYQAYQEGRKEKLTDKEIEIIEKLIYLEKEYRIEPYEEKILELEEWCQEKNEGKKKYERVFPRSEIQGVEVTTTEEREKGQETEEQKEVRLGKAVKSLKNQSKTYQAYQEGRKEELADKEIKMMEKLVNLEKEYKLESYEKSILELEEWCEEKNEGKKRYERVFPKWIQGVKVATPEEREKGQETEEQRERRLCQAVDTFKCQSKIYQAYQEGRKEELTDRKIEIIEKLIEIEKEYYLESYEKSILELEEWCEEKNEGKKRYERVFPKRIQGVKAATLEEREKGQETEEQREHRLARAVSSFKKSNPIYQTYQEGRKEELTDREIEIIEKLIYLESEYRAKKISGQDIGKATYDAPVEMCDQAQSVMNKLVEKDKEKVVQDE